MIMNDDGGTFIEHICFKQKKGRVCTDWMAPLHLMALVQQFWQWIAVTCLERRSHEGEIARSIYDKEHFRYGLCTVDPRA